VQTQFTKAHKGSGLGLSIAKSLAELHGGSIRIRSAVDVGTVVMVALPVFGESLARVQAAASSSVPEVSAPAMRASLRRLATTAVLH
jgi:two-component system, cell cycle sensor histidine kinase PleC